jgi:hypothetical protein
MIATAARLRRGFGAVERVGRGDGPCGLFFAPAISSVDAASFGRDAGRPPAPASIRSSLLNISFLVKDRSVTGMEVTDSTFGCLKEATTLEGVAFTV